MHGDEPILEQKSDCSAAGMLALAGLVEQITMARFNAIREVKSYIRKDMADLEKLTEQHQADYRRCCTGSRMLVNPTVICQAKKTTWERNYECDFAMLGYATTQKAVADWPLKRVTEDEEDSALLLRHDVEVFLSRFLREVSSFRKKGHEHCTPFKGGALTLGAL
ncbi:hypothetical protein N0V93_002108 [Gnomoniopsis smithogilvyi]|uniref:Uncharacterized protein n=1 Tax=Gnomoniopsis smithogilvyi TaxID=1191159 RepID=A0A9W8Z2X5_9PEZI|nr:hypothetical protein N0V93_002108 [Gnomoniopsis smithogilvyi]